MNKFIIEANFSRGVTFKSLISWVFRSRFRLNLTDTLGNNGSSPVFFLFNESRFTVML